MDETIKEALNELSLVADIFDAEYQKSGNIKYLVFKYWIASLVEQIEKEAEEWH